MEVVAVGTLLGGVFNFWQSLHRGQDLLHDGLRVLSSLVHLLRAVLQSLERGTLHVLQGLIPVRRTDGLPLGCLLLLEAVHLKKVLIKGHGSAVCLLAGARS